MYDDFFDVTDLIFDDDEEVLNGVQDVKRLDVHNSYFNVPVPGVYPYSAEGVLKFINEVDKFEPGELLVYEDCKRIINPDPSSNKPQRAPINGKREPIPVVVHQGHLSLITEALFGSNDTFDIASSSIAVDYKKTAYDNLTSSIKYIPKRFIRQTVAVHFRNRENVQILIISKQDKANLFSTYVPSFKYEQVKVVGDEYINKGERFDVIILDFSYCYENNSSYAWEEFLRPGGLLFLPCLKDSSLKQDILSNAKITVGTLHDTYSIPVRNKVIKIPFFKDAFYDSLLGTRAYTVHMYESNHMSNFVEIDDMPKEINSLCNVLVISYSGDAIFEVNLDFAFKKKDFTATPLKQKAIFHPSHYTQADLFFLSRGQRCLFSKKTDGLPLVLISSQEKLTARITVDGVRSFTASIPYAGPKFKIYGECNFDDVLVPTSCVFFDIEDYGVTSCLTSVNYYRLNLFRKIFTTLTVPILYHSFVGPGEYVVHPSYRNGMLQQKIKTATYLKTAFFPTAKKFKYYYDFTYAEGKDVVIKPAFSHDLKPIIGECSVRLRPNKPQQNISDIGDSGAYLFEILRANNPFDDLELNFLIRFFLLDRSARIENFNVSGLLNPTAFAKQKPIDFSRLFFGYFRSLYNSGKHTNTPLEFSSGTFFDFRLVGGVSVKRHSTSYTYKGSHFFIGTDFKGFFCFSNAMVLLYDLMLLFLANR